MAHQHLGLAEIQRLAGLGELFDTLAVFENYPVDRGSLAAEAGGLRLDRRRRARCHALSSEPRRRCRASGCSCGSTIGPTCSSARARRRMAGRLVRLLEAAVADPERAIGSLDILDARRAPHHPARMERHRARGPVRHPAGAVRRAGRRARPMRWRWCSRTSSLSYAELDARANQLAHHLRALGVGPETVVGLCVERSPEMLVGLLGILKAGGAYLPLDPDYPRERLAFMLEDAGAPVLVTQAALLDRLPAHGARIVCLDADWPAIARQPTTAPPSDSSRKTPPMSSTRRDPPERPRAWWSHHEVSSTTSAGRSRMSSAADRPCLLHDVHWRSTRSIFEILLPLLAGEAGRLTARGAAVRDPGTAPAIVADCRRSVSCGSQLHLDASGPARRRIALIGRCEACLLIGGEVLSATRCRAPRPRTAAIDQSAMVRPRHDVQRLRRRRSSSR